MSRWLLGLVVAVCCATAACEKKPPAQPRISPHEQTSGTVDGTRITITYGRPSMRGRAIFGALVPYGQVWCPGADEATTLESPRSLHFGDLAVPAGSHTIWILPNADRWTFVISSEPNGFHTDYHPAADLGRVDMQTRTVDPPVEQLTFTVAPDAAGGGTLTMAWATIAASASFRLDR